MIMGGLLEKIIPVTKEVMEGTENHVLEGEVHAWGHDMHKLNGMILVLKDSMATKRFTHPTLFEPLGRHPNTVEFVRVSLTDRGRLKLELVDPDYSKVIDNTPVFEADPVVLSSVPLELVLKLKELTSEEQSGGRCMMGKKCNGARYDRLDFDRTALVMMPGGSGFDLMCRQCYREAAKADPRVDAYPREEDMLQILLQLQRDNVPLVVLKGWELPLNAPVTTWNCPPVQEIR